MQTQTKFCEWFTKINTTRFSVEPNFPLIPKGGLSLSTERLLLRLSI